MESSSALALGSSYSSVSVSCQTCITSILSLLGFDDFNLNQPVDSSVSLSSSHTTHTHPHPQTSLSLTITQQQTDRHESHTLHSNSSKSKDSGSEKELRSNNLAQFGITPAQIALASQILNSNKKKRSALFSELIINKGGIPNVNYSAKLNSTATRDESSYSVANANANESYETVTEPSVIIYNNLRDRSKQIINSHYDFSSAIVQLTTKTVTTTKIFSKGTEGSLEIPPTAFFLFPSKAVPNVNHKVCEAAIWFLFNLIEPTAAKEMFQSCWPVVDRVQSREFRSITVKALEALKKEGHLPAQLQIRKSYFDDCRGERFEQALLALCMHTLRIVISRDYKTSSNQITPDIKSSAFVVQNKDSANTFSSLSDAIAFLESAYVAHLDEWGSSQEEWMEYGHELESSTNQAVKELNSIKIEKANLASVSQNTPLSELKDMLIKKRKSVKGLWDDLNSYINGHKTQNDILEYVVHDRANKLVLDASNCVLEISESLQQPLKTYMRQNRILPYAQGGLLNLSHVVRLYSLALTQLREAFQKLVVGRFDELDRVGLCVEERVEAVESMGQACRSLKGRLENLVEEVQEAVDNLKSERDRTVNQSAKRLQLQLKSKPFSLAPVTPKPRIKSSLKTSGNDYEEMYSKRYKAKESVATPEIVSKISSQVHQKVDQGALHVPKQPVKNSEQIIDIALAALKINSEQPIVSSRKVVTQNDVSTLHAPLTVAYEQRIRTESWSTQGEDEIAMQTPSKKSCGNKAFFTTTLKKRVNASSRTQNHGLADSAVHRNKKSTHINKSIHPTNVRRHTPVTKKPSKKEEMMDDDVLNLSKDAAAETYDKLTLKHPHNAIDTIASQIAHHILESPKQNSSSNSVPTTGQKPRVRFEVLHAVQNPMNALDTEAFKPKAEIARTPIKPSRNNSPSVAIKKDETFMDSSVSSNKTASLSTTPKSNIKTQNVIKLPQSLKQTPYTATRSSRLRECITIGNSPESPASLSLEPNAEAVSEQELSSIFLKTPSHSKVKSLLAETPVGLMLQEDDDSQDFMDENVFNSTGLEDISILQNGYEATIDNSSSNLLDEEIPEFTEQNSIVFNPLTQALKESTKLNKAFFNTKFTPKSSGNSRKRQPGTPLSINMSRGKRHQLDIQEESKLIDELKDMNIQVVHDLIDFNSPKPTRSTQPDFKETSNNDSLIEWTGGSNIQIESSENPFQDHIHDVDLDYNDNIDRDTHSHIDCSNTGYPFIPLDESTIHKDSSTQLNINGPSSSLLLDTPRPNNTFKLNQLQMDRPNFMYPEFDPVLPVASSLGQSNDLVLSRGREDSANDCDLSEIPRNHPDPSSVVESTGGVSLSKIQGFPSVLLDGFNEWDIGQNDKDVIEGSEEEDNEVNANEFVLKSGGLTMDESEIMHSCVENLDDLSW